MCANHPDTPGIMREVSGRLCRNYRPKPPEPGADARRIVLTNGMVAYVDAADYEEISKHSWRLVSGGYAGRYEKRVPILMHRQIMDPPEGMVVDHIKGNRLDNTRANLRVCTPAENARNRAKPANATSRYIGVFYDTNHKKWAAATHLEGRRKFAGYFDDEEDAARAYDCAAVLYVGEFARLNFPEEWPPERRARVRALRHAESVERKGKAKKAAAKESPTQNAGRPPQDARRSRNSPRVTGHGPPHRRGPDARHETQNARRNPAGPRVTRHETRKDRDLRCGDSGRVVGFPNAVFRVWGPCSAHRSFDV